LTIFCFKKIREKILLILQNNQMLDADGLIPANLENVFAFLDGTAREICRPGGNNALQNAFWNG
jgi:hypothetical protein